MSTLRTITDADFEEVVAATPGLVVVDFWATWCPPCRALEPVLEQLQAEHPGEVTVLKIDADENTESVIRYGALSLPTLKVFSSGEVVKTMVGARPRQALEAELRSLLAAVD